jgi:hypothetical protein
MAQFIITYDLLHAGHLYGKLIDTLKAKGAKQLTLSSWVLHSRLDKPEILEWLTQYLADRDRIAVIEFRSIETFNCIDM